MLFFHRPVGYQTPPPQVVPRIRTEDLPYEVDVSRFRGRRSMPRVGEPASVERCDGNDSENSAAAHGKLLSTHGSEDGPDAHHVLAA